MSIAALFVSIGVLCYQFFEEPKMAYVDSAQLIQQYRGMQDAVEVYQSKATVWQANIDTLANELAKTVQNYEQKKVSLSVNEKELTEKLIHAKRQQLLDYQKTISEKAQGEDQEMTKTVMEQINQYVKRYGQEHKFEIIMGATQAGNLVYAKEGLDITKEVLEGLNAEYQQGRIIQN